MNTPATLEFGPQVRSNDKTHRPVTSLSMYARSAVKSKTEKSTRSSKASSEPAPSYRLGDAVHHGRFGTGQVMAQWPDGTLLVRFDRAVKSRLVWPSLLDRVNGQRH
ncbi:MAG: hypothetical protein ACE5M4_06645 [Anaerolineales bacterium]